MRNLTITSAVQLSQLLNNNPALLAIPAFSNLKNLINHINSQPKAKCNTCSGKANPYAQIKPQLEAALVSMKEPDFIVMKSILNIDKICYYKQDLVTKKLSIVCL